MRGKTELPPREFPDEGTALWHPKEPVEEVQGSDSASPLRDVSATSIGPKRIRLKTHWKDYISQPALERLGIRRKVFLVRRKPGTTTCRAHCHSHSTADHWWKMSRVDGFTVKFQGTLFLPIPNLHMKNKTHHGKGPNLLEEFRKKNIERLFLPSKAKLMFAIGNVNRCTG